MSALLLFVLLIALFVVCNASTAFDTSLQPKEEKIIGSKAHKSIADIVAKATGKIDKTKTKLKEEAVIVPQKGNVDVNLLR